MHHCAAGVKNKISMVGRRQIIKLEMEFGKRKDYDVDTVSCLLIRMISRTVKICTLSGMSAAALCTDFYSP